MLGLGRVFPVARTLLARSRCQVRQIRKKETAVDPNHDYKWYYREINLNVNKNTKMRAMFLGTLMWYWILFHLYYDWGHLVGDHPYPNPKAWTDEELGIPPDEED